MTAITVLEPVEAPLRRSRARPSLTVRDLVVEAVHGFRLATARGDEKTPVAGAARRPAPVSQLLL